LKLRADLTRALRRHHVVLGAFALVFVFYAARYLSFESTPAGDGMYSWVYARSLAFDGDLHLANDYLLCGDPWHLGVDYGAGRPADPFYFGPSLFWAPLLWVARHVVHLPPDASASWVAGCSGPLTRFVGWSGVAQSLATLAIGYRLARRWASPTASLIGMLAVAFGSPLMAYGTTGWFASHVSSALGVALALLLWVRATEAPASRLRPLLAGAALGLAAVMRPNELSWGAGPAAFVGWWIFREARQKKLPLDALVFGATFVVGVLSTFWVQLFVWKLLYGAYWVAPPGKLYMQPWHAHPFLVLFTSRSGLLVFTPLMWLGFLGLLLHGWRSREPAFGRVLLISFVMTMWICSAPLSWSGSFTFSSRLLTNLAAPFVATGALFVDRATAFLRTSRRRRSIALAFALLPVGAIAWGIGKPLRVPADRIVKGPVLYSTGLKASLDETYDLVGNPANLPATLVFAARYRVHPKHFDALSGDGIFMHDYKTTALTTSDTVDFRAPPGEVVLADGTMDAQGLVVTPASRGRFLVSIWWPWVTHVTLAVKAPRDLTLRIQVNGFFTRMGVSGVRVAAGTSNVEIAMPRFAFDSGINEVIVSATDEVVVETMKLIDREKRDTSVK
jgi:hypothetical protein